MKPHIKLWNGKWVCEAEQPRFVAGYGESPSFAFYCAYSGERDR